MTDIMTVGGNSLRAFSRGLATVSDNVANAQTPGYARRRVDQISGEIIRLSDDWRHDEARVALGTAAPLMTTVPVRELTTTRAGASVGVS